MDSSRRLKYGYAMNRNKNVPILKDINILFICALLAISATLNAQSDKKYIRQGNREYAKEQFFRI